VIGSFVLYWIQYLINWIQYKTRFFVSTRFFAHTFALAAKQVQTMDISATDKPGRTLVQTIRDTLHEEILSGLLPAGTQLRQETLAQRFETSRIPVREALRLLEAEGLVNSRPNKGRLSPPCLPRNYVNYWI
jgi:biotin operon repressor